MTILGAKRINSLTEDVKNARECNAIYELVRNSVFTDHLWTFAQKRVALVENATAPVWTDDFVTIRYDLPADFMQLNLVNIRGALVRLEGGKLLSDTSELQIKYTFEKTDSTGFTPKFIEAFAARLAAELAVPITNKSIRAERLFTIYYEKKLPQAISIDSQPGTPTPASDNQWTNARRQGLSGEIVGQTGWDTWFPPCWC